MLIYVSQYQGGDSTVKTVKAEQEGDQGDSADSHTTETFTSSVDQHIDYAAPESSASTSNVYSIARPEQPDYDQLPHRMRGMEITDNKSENHDDRVNILFPSLELQLCKALFCFLKESNSFVLKVFVHLTCIAGYRSHSSQWSWNRYRSDNCDFDG